MVKTVPEGIPPGSDVANLSVIGYDPKKYYTGRSPLEAVSMGVELSDIDLAFRCNLVTLTIGDSYESATMLDYSSDEISTAEAAELINEINKYPADEDFTFYPGISYRHLMVWANGSADVGTTPPHDVMGQPITPNLPVGDGEAFLRQLMWDSYEIMQKQEINRRREGEGKHPANMIWLWGQGYAPRLTSFSMAHGVTGTVISAVDLIRGIARLAGLRAPAVPNVTGRLDTNWAGKAAAARAALAETDFVMVHAEAPDECGHQGDLEGKIRAIELVDHEIVGPVWEAAQQYGNARILVLPDHYTPIARRTHVGLPVPFVLSGTGITADRADRFDEAIAEESSIIVDEGWTLIQRLLA
jgi:2,3-bisphosphoglycerate-independent phosphoglycerate mutase